MTEDTQKILLESGDLKRFRPLGADGQPVYQAAARLRASITRQMGHEMADVFAIPQINEHGSRIDWYASMQGVVVPWSAATDEERDQAKSFLADIRRTIQQHADQLLEMETSNSDRRTFARLLRHITEFPGHEHVYLVDGNPVIAFWGFHGSNMADDRDSISLLPVQSMAAKASIPPLAPAVAESVVLPLKSRRRFPWCLLLLLLLLLLLIPLFWWLFARSQRAVAPTEEIQHVQLDETGSDRSTALDETRMDRNSDSTYQSDRTVNIDRDERYRYSGTKHRDSSLHTDEDIKRKIDRNENMMTHEAADSYSELGDQQARHEDFTPPAPELDQETGAGETPRQNGAHDRTDIKQQGPPLQLPSEAMKNGATQFLDGTWYADTGLMDRSGRQVRVGYEFKNGEGSTHYYRSDGVECIGPTSARIEGDELVLQDQDDIRCEDGIRFKRSTVRCNTGGGNQAQCHGYYDSGEQFSVDLFQAPEKQQ